MAYRCIKGDGARPCVNIIKFDAETGKELPKPIRKYKSVKMGEEVAWVDFTSRKHFEPTDKETIRRDAEDFKEIKKELSDLNVTLPPDATFAECADSLARLKAKPKTKAGKKLRIFTPESSSLSKEDEVKKWLDKHDVKYHHKAGYDKLKELKEEKLKELESGEPEEQ